MKLALIFRLQTYLRTWLKLGSQVLLCVLMLGTSSFSFALPSDQAELLKIRSERFTADDNRGINIYWGSVELTQGTMKILADKLTVFRLIKKSPVDGSTENNSFRIVAEGKRASFEQQPELNKGLIKAFGNTIEYFTQERKIILTDRAEVTQDGETFIGKQITYDLDQRVISAKGNEKNNDPESSDRVLIVIHPNNHKPGRQTPINSALQKDEANQPKPSSQEISKDGTSNTTKQGR